MHGQNSKTNKQSSAKKENIAITFLWLLIITLLFLISSRLYFRIDMTKNRANTLSSFSRSLWRSLDEPLVITYFVSERLAQTHPLPGEISDLLDEYASNSSGMIRFIRTDPQRLGMDREMELLGIPPRQMMITEKNESALTYVYSGILLEYLDRMEIIPLAFSLDNLEYELSSRILSLLRERNRELGIIVGDASKEWEAEYMRLSSELSSAGFNLRLIEIWEEIPPGLNCLFVLGGAEDLDEWALYRIDRFIQAGGGVLFAASGIVIDFEQGFAARPAADLGLLAVLSFYGASVREALVLDTASLSVSFQEQKPDGSFVINTMRYPQWIAVSSQTGNRLNPVTSDFQGLDLYWASPIELYPPPGVDALPLFSSSADAWLQTRDFVAAFDKVSFFEEEREQTVGTKILGAALSGIFPPAFLTDFHDHDDPDDHGHYDSPPKPSRIIVVGNTEFAGALMNATLAESRNLDFLVKSALWLGGEEGLMDVRKRQGETLRLDKIQDPEKKNRARNFSMLLNVIMLPLAVIAAGLFIVARRSIIIAARRGKEK